MKVYFISNVILINFKFNLNQALKCALFISFLLIIYFSLICCYRVNIILIFNFVELSQVLRIKEDITVSQLS